MMNEENKNQSLSAVAEEVEQTVLTDPEEENEPLDKNVRLLSPGRMVARRFFRSKLSIIGMVMLVSLLLFSFVGPLVYTKWEGPNKDGNKQDSPAADGIIDEEEKAELLAWDMKNVTYTDADGNKVTFTQASEYYKENNSFAAPSQEHLLGTDEMSWDVFTRLMYGGRKSLLISFIAVITITVLGVVMGGIAGYFGGVVDNIIMRICDILMCLPGIPILLIVSTALNSLVDPEYLKEIGRTESWLKSEHIIYLLMACLALISWPGTARLVRGQILSLREQEYMVAAEAMGYSVPRRIFKHLVPNVMPQLIVSMTMSLGSMILYEASLTYLGMGVGGDQASWGAMINLAKNTDVLENYFNIWGPPGICIVIAVLGFNFIGDGLRDALDPKMRR